jgi:hypothetical protein
MKITTDGVRAHLVESVVVTKRVPGQLTRELFAVDGRLGLYVRVRSDCDTHGVFEAYYNGGIRAFLPATGVMEELAQANIEPTGLMDASAVQDTPPAEPLPGNVFRPGPDDHPATELVPGLYEDVS